MTRRHARTAAVVALAVAAAAGYRWWTSPERQIRAILADVAAALTHSEPDAGLQSLSAVATLQRHLALAATIETPQWRISGRQEIVAAAARVRAATPMMRLRFFDPRITLDGPAAATIEVTAEVTMRNDSGDDVVDVHQVSATVEEVSDSWHVTSARTVPDGEPDS